MDKKMMFRAVVVASSFAAITFLSYKVYKAYQMVKAEMLEDEEVLEAEFEEYKDVVTDLYSKDTRTNDEIIDELFEDEVEELEHGYSETSLGVIVSDESCMEEDEESEENELRHHPDSEAALNQYIEMRLSDLPRNSNARNMLAIFFEYTDLTVSTEEDERVIQHIIEERMDFFGPNSVWIKPWSISFAEVVLHFGEMLSMDLDRTVLSQLDMLLCNVLATYSNSGNSEELSEIVTDVMNHTHSFGGWFGIFKLLDIPEVRRNTHFYDQYWKYTFAEMECESGITDEIDD